MLMTINCAYTELVDLHKLVENPKNPNKHPDRQIAMLAKIIDYQGQRSPIVVSRRSGFITKGHGRLMAIRKLGWDKCAVDYQTYEDEAQEYADMVADNKIAELAEHDDKFMTDIILAEFPDIDLELLGLDDFKLEVPFEGKTDEDAVPDDVPARAKLGDIYQLGNHRLMCGDSTDKDTVEQLMNGEKADIVYTDPPYGIDLDTDYKSMGKNWISNRTGLTQQTAYRKIEGDSKDFDPSFIMNNFEYCKEILIWGGDHFYPRLPDKGSWIVWDKRRSDNFEVKETVDNLFGSHFEVLWSRQKHRREIIRLYRVFGASEGSSGEKPSANVVNQQHFHPTQKPVPLHEKIFERIAGTNVVDLFGGSGSTLIACEKTNRKCFMMELDPHYVDVIVKRWEDYTGRKAELISSLDKTKPIHDTMNLSEKNL